MTFHFVESPRQVTFDWHITQVIKWLEFDDGRKLDSVLVYACLEMRLSIERYLFELLALLKNLKFCADEERKCRSVKGIFAMMQEADPNYRKTVEFTKIVASVIPNVPEITMVDTTYLRKNGKPLAITATNN